MTEKKYRETVLKLGGVISSVKCVDFPDTFRITTKSEAIDVLDIILLASAKPPLDYTISIDNPLLALKCAIKKGVV